MEERENGKGITLGDLGALFLRRVGWIAVVAITAVLAALLIFSLTYTPRYCSTAVLYVLRQDGQTDLSDDLSYDFSTALKVVNDCEYLLRSAPVLNEMSDRLGADALPARFAQQITVENPRDTRILEVTVEADSPEEAVRLVNLLCDVGVESINAAMGFDQVRLYANGERSETPANRISPLLYVAIGLIAAVASYAVFVFLLLIDDRLRTDADFRRALNVDVLGDLPFELRAEACVSEKTRVAYEALRANLRFDGRWSGGAIALVPMTEREGCFAAACRLAEMYAALQEKVLVVHADFRRPNAEGKGLASLLSGACTVDECISETAVSGVYLLPSGSAELPAELLEGDSFRELLARLCASYDRVIVVTPPLAEAIDGAIVASACGAALAIFGDGRVRCDDAKRLTGMLLRSKTVLCGVVRLRIPRRVAGKRSHTV